MKRYALAQTGTGKVLFGIVLFFMLLLTRNTLLASSILGFNKSQFLMLGIVAVYGVVFLAVNRRELKEILTDKRLLAAGAAAALILLPMVAKQDWTLMYFSVLLGVFLAVFFSFFISLEDAAKCYVVILTLLGVYSILATYALRILPDKKILQIPIFLNSHKVKFYNFGLAFVSKSYVKNRNFGIFREPGVYQYFIILALLLNNYVITWKKQRSFWIVNVLLGFTMLTTFATGGVAELGLLVLVVFFEKKLYKNKRILCIAIALVVLLAAALVLVVIRQGELYWELYGMLAYKFQPGVDSSSDRLNAVIADLDFFVQSPLVGAKIADVLHSVDHNTSSTMLMFAMFGLPGAALHLISWGTLIWEKKRNFVANCVLMLLMFLSFNTQNLVADVFFWLFPVMALLERGLPKLKLQKKKV